MLVSVVIPLYNKASHIQRVRSTPFRPRPMRISRSSWSTTDRPTAGRKSCDVAPSAVRLIKQENAGVSAARNRAQWKRSRNFSHSSTRTTSGSRIFWKPCWTLREKFPEAGVWGTAYSVMDAQGAMRHVSLEADVRRQTGGLIINFFRYDRRTAHSLLFHVGATPCSKAGGFLVGLVRLEDTDTLLSLGLRNAMAHARCQTIYHMEAENRTDRWLYSGNFPFFEHARAFLRESGGANQLSEDVSNGILRLYGTPTACTAIGSAGNSAAMREFISDCPGIPGYRLKCFLWRFLVWIPYSRCGPVLPGG